MAERAQKLRRSRAEKGRGRSKGGINQTTVPNSTHNRGVEFHVPFYIIWMLLCSFCQKGVEQAWLYFYYSGLELSACVCVLGGGGITHPFLLSTDHQEKIKWLCGPCRLMHARARKIYPPSPRHRCRKMFWLGGSCPLPPTSYAYARVHYSIIIIIIFLKYLFM